MSDTREDFCPACVAIPMAMVGMGTSAYGVSGNNHTTKDEHKRKKQLMFIIGLILTLLSVFIAIYFLYIKKCKKCR